MCTMCTFGFNGRLSSLEISFLKKRKRRTMREINNKTDGDNLEYTTITSILSIRTDHCIMPMKTNTDRTIFKNFGRICHKHII
jgi:hypothetical protein